MMRCAGCLSLLLGLSSWMLAAQDNPAQPGSTTQGFLLPNGWTISPAGKQVLLTDMPLNILPLADSRRALVATNGYNRHELSLVDLQDGKVLHTEPALQSWFGLALSSAQDQVWWSAGGANGLHTFDLKENKLIRTGAPDRLPAPGAVRHSVERARCFHGGSSFWL